MKARKITTVIAGILLFTGGKLFSQSLPACIEKIKADTVKNKLAKYSGTLKLPNGETVYRIVLERRKGCMDCNSGVYYTDSLCERVASFMIGNAPTAFIKKGYKQEYFMETKTPAFSSALKRAEQARGLFFPEERKFSVKTVQDTSFTLFKRTDELRISNAAGLHHYVNGKLKNSYKIIPYQLATLSPDGQEYKVYYIDALKKFMRITDVAGYILFYLTRKEYEEHELKAYSGNEWMQVMQLQ